MLAPGKDSVKVLQRRTDPIPCVPDVPKDEHVTLLLGISAANQPLPKLVIYPLKTLPPLEDELLYEFQVAGQASGWMDQAIFRNMIENFYVPAINKIRAAMNKPDAVALIIYDGSSTHFGIDLDELFSKHRVKMLLLPAHSSALLQPLDLSVNGELKQYLAKKFKAIANESAPDRRNRLLKVTAYGLDRALSRSTIQTGWERTGLWPICPETVMGSDMINHYPTLAPAPEMKKHKRGLAMSDGNIVAVDKVIPSPPKSRKVDDEVVILEQPSPSRFQLKSIDDVKIVIRQHLRV